MNTEPLELSDTSHADEPCLSPTLHKFLEGTKQLTEEDLNRLDSAGRELYNDPRWHAEFLRSRFIVQVQEAMASEGLSRKVVANRWGKSRQYLSNILGERRKASFTLDTMAALSHYVGRRLSVSVDPIEPADDIFVSFPIQFQEKNKPVFFSGSCQIKGRYHPNSIPLAGNIIDVTAASSLPPQATAA